MEQVEESAAVREGMLRFYDDSRGTRTHSPGVPGVAVIGTARDEGQTERGDRLPTRLTAVLREDEGEWKAVHLHFSVGVPDEQAVVPAAG
jgi:hypothetical protein